ncbi:MAG TPA: hypothetical protein VI653_15125 [Steroidobacteraceae bacterium]
MRQRTSWVFAWLTVLSVALGYVVLGQAAAERKVSDFDEINVHRINIIEPDGKPRVIISDRARMAGLYWGGKEYKHPTRDEGGFLFFNDDGDEVGGMTFGNRRKGTENEASSSLLFDQYKQDQTVGIMYNEQDGKRRAGLRVWDRPDQSLFPAVELSDALARARTDDERNAIRAKMDALVKSWGPHPVAERFFAGKALDDAVVKLADKQGRPRLVLKVDGAGAASIDVLDEDGKVTRHFP